MKAASTSDNDSPASALTAVIPSNGESRAKWYSHIMIYFVVSFKALSLSPQLMYPQLSVYRSMCIVEDGSFMV